MGLDQYLYATRPLDGDLGRSVWERAVAATPYYDHSDPDSRDEIYLGGYEFQRGDQKQRGEYEAFYALGAELFLAEMIDSASPHLEVTRSGDTYSARLCAAYWRKANAIHDWFVNECQGGVDECEYSEPIDGEKLAHLMHLCEQAVAAYDAGEKDKAAALLKPRSGFFFGGYDIDDYYRTDLVETIEKVKRSLNGAIAIRRDGGPEITFRYLSSW